MTNISAYGSHVSWYLQQAVTAKCYRATTRSLALNNSVLNDLIEIEIAWNNGDADTFYTSVSGTTPPDPTSNNSQDQIIYAGVGPANLQNNAWLDNTIKPSTHDIGDYYDVNLKDSGGDTIDTVRYYLVCEPKYTPYQIAFINRFGVADFITFFKRSDERGNFTQDTYQKSIYNDGFTTPSLEVGKYNSFNVNSRNSLTLNTGFVDQDYDETIKDILMSEYVAVLENTATGLLCSLNEVALNTKSTSTKSSSTTP
jgi:hypothetical protein